MSTTFGGQTAETTGIPISRPLVDGSKVGSFFPVLQVSLTTADTAVPINLGRQPSGYITITAPNGGGVVTAGSNNGTDWTTTQIVLAASVAGQYSILVF
jgi:hypothetical protein